MDTQVRRATNSSSPSNIDGLTSQSETDDEDASENSLRPDEDDYPFCVPSYSPCITDHEDIQALLQNSELFSETKCDILEASASGCHWYRNVDDEALLKLLAERKPDVSYYPQSCFALVTQC